MNCPICNIPMLLIDRQGVEIDFCPQCRGIWLERGELNKIIDRSARIETTWHHYFDIDDRKNNHTNEKCTNRN